MTNSDRNPIDEFCEAYILEREIDEARHTHPSFIRSEKEERLSALRTDEKGFPRPLTRAYPGLRSFTPREERLFFGRTTEAAELRNRLALSNVVVVLGGSGSGKSSLVLAGLLPRLNDVGQIPGRTGRWYTATFRPGDAPCDRIVEALWNDVCQPLLALKQGPQAIADILLKRDNNQAGEINNSELRNAYDAIVKPEGRLAVEGVKRFLATLDEIDARLAELRGSFRSGSINLLLLADQFEELFRDSTSKEKKEDIEIIIDLLQFARQHPQEPICVVATLRSEELHRCAEIDGLAPIVNDGFYLLDRPAIKSLMEAVVNPGRQTLFDWGMNITDSETSRAATKMPVKSGEHAPFSTAFLEKLRSWIEKYQSDERIEGIEADRRRRHQADLLPLFQHLLRITWGMAVSRWGRERSNVPTVEPSDILNWIADRKKRVEDVRKSMQAIGAPTKLSDPSRDNQNVLEACLDTGFAITLSEAITDKSWDELETWPAFDQNMKERLLLIQAAFIVLATRDDNGNYVRHPARAEEILASTNLTFDAKKLARVLSFFKARNYLRGGDAGEPYDVNHEALIRNSTDYQAWLIDADKVGETIHRANAALLAAGLNRPLKEERSRWRKYLNEFTLRRYRVAAQRLSDHMCRDMERIFGANAAFKSAWMAERAELPGTRDERRNAMEQIRLTWEDAQRWRLDFSIGQSQGPSLFQRSAILLKGIWKSYFRVKTEPKLSGMDVWRVKVLLLSVLVGLVLASLLNLIGYYAGESAAAKSHRNVLQVLADVSDAGNPKAGADNDTARSQLMMAGRHIGRQSTEAMNEVARRDLVKAAAQFDTVVRLHLGRVYFHQAVAGGSKQEPPRCIVFDPSNRTRASLSINQGNRRFELDDIKQPQPRLVAKYGGNPQPAEKRPNINLIQGYTIVCGLSNLDYLVAWTDLSGDSIPQVYPVEWFKYNDQEYATIGMPFPTHYINTVLSNTITSVSKAIVKSLEENELKLQISAQEKENDHWTVVSFSMGADKAFGLQFARGVQKPMMVPREQIKFQSCITAGKKEATSCSVSPEPSNFGIKVLSKNFDPANKELTGLDECKQNDVLCSHKITVTHSTGRGDARHEPAPRDGATLNYLVAPPITDVGLWKGYLVIKDKDETLRAVPVERDKLLNIIGKVQLPEGANNGK